MKIINEKGKLFGVINIVDLLVLVAAIAVVAGVGYKLFAPRITEAVSPQVEMTAVVRVRGAMPFLVDEIERNDQTGKKMVSGNAFVDATIEKVEIEDYVQQMPTADGEINNALDPSKKDIVFTIKTKVNKGTASPKIGTQEVRFGRTLIVKTDDMELNGTITSVEIADE